MAGELVSFQDYLSKKNLMRESSANAVSNALCVQIQNGLQQSGLRDARVLFEKNHMFVILNASRWDYYVKWRKHNVKVFVRSSVEAMLRQAGVDMHVHVYRQASGRRLIKDLKKLGLLKVR